MLNLGKEELKNIIKSNNGDLISVIELINISKTKEDDQDIEESFEELGIEVRICSVCNKVMIQGYCVEDGYEYACSDECIKSLIAPDKLETIQSKGEIDIYYTDWTEVDDNGQVYGGINYAL